MLEISIFPSPRPYASMYLWRMLPEAARWDAEKIFPVETLREAAALGFGGIYVKEDVGDRKSTRLNSSHRSLSRMPSSA